MHMWHHWHLDACLTIVHVCIQKQMITWFKWMQLRQTKYSQFSHSLFYIGRCILANRSNLKPTNDGSNIMIILMDTCHIRNAWGHWSWIAMKLYHFLRHGYWEEWSVVLAFHYHCYEQICPLSKDEWLSDQWHWYCGMPQWPALPSELYCQHCQKLWGNENIHNKVHNHEYFKILFFLKFCS